MNEKERSRVSEQIASLRKVADQVWTASEAESASAVRLVAHSAEMSQSVVEEIEARLDCASEPQFRQQMSGLVVTQALLTTGLRAVLEEADHSVKTLQLTRADAAEVRELSVLAPRIALNVFTDSALQSETAQARLILELFPAAIIAHSALIRLQAPALARLEYNALEAFVDRPDVPRVGSREQLRELLKNVGEDLSGLAFFIPNTARWLVGLPTGVPDENRILREAWIDETQRVLRLERELEEIVGKQQSALENIRRSRDDMIEARDLFRAAMTHLRKVAS